MMDGYHDRASAEHALKRELACAFAVHVNYRRVLGLVKTAYREELWHRKIRKENQKLDKMKSKA